MRFVRRQLLVYVAIGIVVVAIGARFLFTHDSSSGEGGGGSSGVALAAASPAPGPVESPATTPSPSAPAEVVVDVAGAVTRPGVYRLPEGSRVCDALELAGGTTAKAQTAAVNLAARLVDGQQIAIPEKVAAGSAVPAGSASTAASSGTTSGAPAAPVNLNTATLEQLDALSGVGPSTAQKIIDYREQNGGFGSVDELQEVSGIGDAKFAALKDLVTV